MKILHTSDWHLGQKLQNKSRHEEHRQALDWLLQLIDNQGVEVLIHAGDVFDTMNPPNDARQLYFNFLRGLLRTNCRHVVIVGGNHDSPSMLNAPQALLKSFNIHVLGCATEDLQDEIIELRAADGRLEAVVAAVPFLRDPDLRRSVAGELNLERIERIQAGIRRHYQQIAELMQPYEAAGVPLIATGHLFATGAKDEKESKIYVGNLENIHPDGFPALFDYVALGHIHRPQRVNFLNHIRYAGSLIPLDFSELGYEKSVYILNFDGRKFEKETHLVPQSRTLLQIKGNYEAVTLALRNLPTTNQHTLKTWLEVVIETEKPILNLMGELSQLLDNQAVELINVKVNSRRKGRQLVGFELNELKNLDEVAVFVKKCESEKLESREIEELTLTFRELLNWMSETEI